MVDLKNQYLKIKQDIDEAVISTIESTEFINGRIVHTFQTNLEHYLGVKHVIPCANGTDALQIALMALDLQAEDEIILPAFTYVATAEVIALLKLKPILVDVDINTFNISIESIRKAINPKTKAIVPVHLFGQCAAMEEIMNIAKEHNLFVIEDTAQAIGADYIFSDNSRKKAGTIGTIGCTSFFPSKNLGCYGDGGAIFTNDTQLAQKMRMIANHGQSKRYYHDIIGVNSRLDSIQAAILNIKLPYLDAYCDARRKAADYYDAAFKNIPEIITPQRFEKSTHVFHQYTICIKSDKSDICNKRDKLKEYLEENNIPAMIYYPVPLHHQEAFKNYPAKEEDLKNTLQLCNEVISLPMHTELNENVLEKIVCAIKAFFKR